MNEGGPKQSVLCDPEDTEPVVPEGSCPYFKICGNMIPGGVENGNALCASCLSAFRMRGEGGDDYDRRAYLRERYGE